MPQNSPVRRPRPDDFQTCSIPAHLDGDSRATRPMDLDSTMSSDPALDVAVRRELLRLGMLNSARSVPLQLIAVVIVGVLGFIVDAKILRRPPWSSVWPVGVWRRSLSQAIPARRVLSEDEIARLDARVGSELCIWQDSCGRCARSASIRPSRHFRNGLYRHCDWLCRGGGAIHAARRTCVLVVGAHQFRIAGRRQPVVAFCSIVPGRDSGRHSRSHHDSGRAGGYEHHHPRDSTWAGKRDRECVFAQARRKRQKAPIWRSRNSWRR